MAQVVVIAITGLFIMPLLILLGVQLKNFVTNRTTNERFAGKRYAVKDESDSES